jgi:beta-amylase
MWTLRIVLAVLVLIGGAPGQRAKAAGIAAVMAPLTFLPPECKDFDDQACSIQPETMQRFTGLLTQAKNIGVQTVSVDVWWRLVEGRGDQQFDWRYYDQVFRAIRDAGLTIAPILSFHQCGGGPGDDCNFPLPDWIWSRFAPELTGDDMQYQSESGKAQSDALPPWASMQPKVLQQFTEFMQAFAAQYGSAAGDFLEINVSLGPTGELRYPSYNMNDGWSFPDRGNFQAYGTLARQSFRQWALVHFGGLTGVASRWGISLATEEQIRPPGGELPVNGTRRAQAFVDQQDYVRTQYGRDFIDWYNESLVEHGRRLLLATHNAFSGSLRSVPIAMKIPGVHWQMTCTDTPRIAEITAGLVQTTLDLRPEREARADAYGYRRILDMIADVKRQTGRDIILHFTALEMDNSAACDVGSRGRSNTSLAEALVFWVSEAADDRDILHRGENALACFRNWDHIENVFRFSSYSGLNFLRLTNSAFSRSIGRSPADCEPWSDFERDQYRNFIAACISASCRAH